MSDPRAARTIGIVRALARRRWIGVPVLAAVSAWTADGFAPGDFAEFGVLGRAVLHGHLDAAYATSFDQSGPLQLLAAAVVPLKTTASSAMSFIEISWGVAIAVGAMVLVRLLRRLEDKPPSPVRELAAGVAASVSVVAGSALTGHLAELVVPVAWVIAAVTIRGPGRAASTREQVGHPGPAGWILAGVLLGTAAGFEPWAVLGLPVLLLADHLRRAAAATALAVSTAAFFYLPFVLAGPFRMSHHQWPVERGTLIHLLWPAATTFGWQPRLLQAAVCVGMGSAVALALRHRRSVDASWLVPAAILLSRVLLDPVQFDYYWVAPQLVIIAGLAFIELRRASLGIAAALWLVSFPVWPTPCAAAALAVVIALSVGERRYQPRVASRWSTGTSSTLMPTMASPSPRDTFAITSGSS